MKKISLKEISIFISIIFGYVFTRLPFLGYDTFNTDVWRWKQRSYDFGTGVFTFDFERTIQMYHPGVPLMWINAIAVKIYNFYYGFILKADPGADSLKFVFELNFLQKLLISIVIGGVLALTFFGLRKLFNTTYALIGVILISLEPFFIALSREIHLEALMSVFMIASFVYIFLFTQENAKGRYLILAGLFSALAALTKSSGVFIVLFNGLIVILYFLLKKDWMLSKRLIHILSNGISVVLWFVFFYMLIWPAMLTYPSQALTEVMNGILSIGVEGGHEQIYFGKLVDDPGPLYYPLVILLRSSFYLVFGLIGMLFIYKKLDAKQKNFTLALLLLSALYLIQLTIPTKKLDRYILPSILSMLLISAFVFEFVFRKISNKVLVPLIFTPALFYLVAFTPDYFAYFNPMFGGLRVGASVFEPKWFIGGPETQDFFRQVKEKEGHDDFLEGESLDDFLYEEEAVSRKLVVAYPEKYYTQIWPFFRQMDSWAVILNLSGHSRLAGYYVYPVWEDTSNEETRYDIEYYDSIYKEGVELWRVYRRVWE